MLTCAQEHIYKHVIAHAHIHTKTMLIQKSLIFHINKLNEYLKSIFTVCLCVRVCTCTLKHMDGNAHVHMHTYRGRRTALMVFLTGLELAKVANPRYLPIPSSPALQLQMGTTILGLNSGPKASMKRTLPTEAYHQP